MRNTFKCAQTKHSASNDKSQIKSAVNSFCGMQDYERSESARPGKTQMDRQHSNVSDSTPAQLPSTTTYCQISHPTNTIRFPSLRDHSSVFPSLCRITQVTLLYVTSCRCSKINWAILPTITLLRIRIVRPFDFNTIEFTSIEHNVSTTQATACALYKIL